MRENNIEKILKRKFAWALISIENWAFLHLYTVHCTYRLWVVNQLVFEYFNLVSVWMTKRITYETSCVFPIAVKFHAFCFTLPRQCNAMSNHNQKRCTIFVMTFTPSFSTENSLCLCSCIDTYQNISLVKALDIWKSKVFVIAHCFRKTCVWGLHNWVCRGLLKPKGYKMDLNLGSSKNTIKWTRSVLF